MNKSLAILAGIISIALIILAVFVYSSNKPSPVEETPKAITKVDLKDDELPSGFPKDLPIEAGSTTQQNYEAKAIDGRKQSTLSTTTSKTLPQAVKVYQDYFSDLGWIQALEPEVSPEIVRVSFRKDDDFLTIEAKKGLETEENTIDITLVEVAK